MHEPKVQSVTEGGAAAGATALVKEKPSSYVGGARQRLIEKKLRQLSTFIFTIKTKSLCASECKAKAV